jgi:transcription-repair coupling factor (superfamily II helicase)
MPVEVQNLIFVVKLKALGIRSGVEAISTNDDIITVRLFPGMQPNRQKLIPFYRYGIKIGITQVIINLKRLGKEWQKILEDIVKSVL